MPRPSKGTDVFVYKLLDSIVPLFCRLHIHPDYVTCISILSKFYLFQLMSLKLNEGLKLNKGTILLCILFHSISDCLDGEVARSCNKSSSFGSRLDSFNDHLYFGIIVLFVIVKYYRNVSFSLYNVIICSSIVFMINTCVLDFNIDTHDMNNVASFLHDNTVILSLLYFIVFIT